jgi:hypothetical protein
VIRREDALLDERKKYFAMREELKRESHGAYYLTSTSPTIRPQGRRMLDFMDQETQELLKMISRRNGPEGESET